MSAHVILNLLNQLRKSVKMWGLPSVLSLFCCEFNKFNNTRAQIQDSIYHVTQKILSLKSYLSVKKSRFWPYIHSSTSYDKKI